MPRTPRLLALAAAALLLPAAAASAASFSGTTADGNPITFDAQGDVISAVNTSYPVYCTNRAGLELFQPTGTFLANGSENTTSELMRSAILNREVTQNVHFTASITGTEATGAIDVNFSTIDYDLLSNTMKTTICSGKTTFTAATAAVAQPPQQQDPPQKQDGKKKAKKKKKKQGKRKGAGRV